MSLVANYTDSEEDNENSETSAEIEVNPSEKCDDTQKNPNKSLNLFGVLDEQPENSSNSDSEDSEDNEGIGQKVNQRLKKSDIQLDNPFRYFGSGSVSAQDSVLRVEFREQEAHKTAVLERHVKMTESAGVALTINGKKICWNHRKGKCRFGHNCKFAHDSDILPSDSSGVQYPEKTFEPLPSANFVPVEPVQKPKRQPFSNNEETDDPPATVVFASSAHLSGENNSTKKRKSEGFSDDELDDTNNKQTGRKKRPGLSTGLVPGKKTMNMYFKSKTS